MTSAIIQPVRLFSCNAPATACPRGQVESSRSASRTVRNDSEAHPMSPVRRTPVKSSRCRNGEDESERSLTGVVPQHRRSLNNRCCAHHHGGVSGRGMPEQAVRLKVEVCGGGQQSPSERTSVHNARRPCAAAEVGAAHSSDEGGNDAGAKEPCLNEANREGKAVVMAPQGDSNTREKRRKLRRRLCRKTKARARWRTWRRPKRHNPPLSHVESRTEERSRKAGCGKPARPV